MHIIHLQILTNCSYKHSKNKYLHFMVSVDRASSRELCSIVTEIWVHQIIPSAFLYLYQASKSRLIDIPTYELRVVLCKGYYSEVTYQVSFVVWINNIFRMLKNVNECVQLAHFLVFNINWNWTSDLLIVDCESCLFELIKSVTFM